MYIYICQKGQGQPKLIIFSSFITKTCLFKYTEKLITEKLKIFRQKIQIFFMFLLKTYTPVNPSFTI